MGQDDIINFLKLNRKKWFSKANLKGKIPVNDSTLVKNISKCVKYSSYYGLKTKKGKKGKNFLRFD